MFGSKMRTAEGSAHLREMKLLEEHELTLDHFHTGGRVGDIDDPGRRHGEADQHEQDDPGPQGDARRHYFPAGRPIAKRLRAVRTYMTPPESAGVAISSSPIGLIAISLNSSPAETTTMSPSSFDR